MRKQVDFSFRVLEYNSITPGQSSADWSAYIRETYLNNGWEILSTEVIRAEANSVFLGLSFVLYADVVQPEEQAIAKRGRPRKEVAGIQVAEDASG